jgi:spore coat polysaccharide biosynthesis protein SpsF
MSLAKPKVVATLACRVQSKRLYAKPLQFLDIENEITILEYLVNFLKTIKTIDKIVLAVSEGEENIPFHRLARQMEVPFIIGSQHDVQGRLIQACDSVGGDIIYRVTTECPFIYMDTFEETLAAHVKNKASLTVIEGLPEGTYYEIISAKDIKRAHDEGEKRHRSELCTLYMAENPDKFFIQKITVADGKLRRPDIRLTVDYPEDLIVVRELHSALKREGHFLTIAEIVDFLDDHPQLLAVNDWIEAGQGRIWK